MWHAVLDRAADRHRARRIPGNRPVVAVRLATENRRPGVADRPRPVPPRVDARRSAGRPGRRFGSGLQRLLLRGVPSARGSRGERVSRTQRHRLYPGAQGRRGPTAEWSINSRATRNLRRRCKTSPAQFPKKSRPTLADLQAVLPKRDKPPAGVRTVTIPDIDIGQRNTPALFGASVIDAIPDAAILANERNLPRTLRLAVLSGEAVTNGRAARLPRKRVGKFGWKANIGNLSEFVRVACANELGLGNPLQAQPASLSRPDYRPRGLDLTDQQCDLMTAYIASLPAPREVIPSSPAEAARAAAGKKHFKQIGCVSCHTPDLAEAQGLYSDLLLHEMGEGLGGGGGGFYGEESPTPEDFDGGSISPSEWRTPPLWGVADSAPYLHDGRAATLADAIRLHAGQASSSANHFAGLSDVQQDELIAFLNTLRAPGVGDQGRELPKDPTPSRSAARLAFRNSPKLKVGRLDAGTLPVASISIDFDR